MEKLREEYFGSETQQALQRRADQLWRLLQEDPWFTCYGRSVGFARDWTDDPAAPVAIARLLGACSVEGVPSDHREPLKAHLTQAGLITDEYFSWANGPRALELAQEVLASRRLRPDLAVVEVTSDTPSQDLRALDRFTQTCDVLLPMGRFIRGEAKPACCIYVQEPDGTIVGASASVALFHPAHAKAGRCWWGLLATADHRRGEGIALILGAMTMLAMRDRFGYTDFFTGIREGNVVSEKLCAKLGFAPDGTHVVLGIDAETMKSSQVTK